MPQKRFTQRSFSVLFLLVLIATGTGLLRAATKNSLPSHYAAWLNQEVPYIITNTERSAFLDLKTDADRDAFIQNFWAIRNPDPNSPTNEFRDEYYRRLAYANDRFGSPGRHDGWRTDRGMVYITLGPPQQLTPYRASQYLTPLEIWFYQSPSPNHALPPYFYVVFYQRSLNEDYKLYSPFLDKPERLVQSTNAVNDEAVALKIIKEDLGAEVARISLTLLPNEPASVDSPSLESETLLNRIRNYRNLPENVELLDERRAMHESVSHRIVLGQSFSDLSAMATRDGDALASISYLFQLFNPQDFFVAQGEDGRFYYNVEVEAGLKNGDGQVIYQDTQKMMNYLTAADVAERRQRRFALEGRLPASPGAYTLQLTVTNQVTHQAFTQSRNVVVPPFDSQLNLSTPMLLTLDKPNADTGDSLPFTLAGVQFAPLGSDNASVPHGSPLRVMYQLWDKASSSASPAQGTLDVVYTLGQLGRPEKQQTPQSVDKRGFDHFGNLLIGKDLATDALSPGPYRLVIQVTDPASGAHVSQALNLTITNPRPPLWTVVSPSFHPRNDPLDAFRRGQCALSQHDRALAVYYLRQSIAAGYPAREAYTALAAAYREAGNIPAAEEAAKQAEQNIPVTRHD
ncbi:MAG TPA: GWxTD domain-containing protein [Acidobacteriaceae bacterium]|nr:GWxTD domain-containing protein [Acidobacteriaceae bacterium]